MPLEGDLLASVRRGERLVAFLRLLQQILVIGNTTQSTFEDQLLGESSPHHFRRDARAAPSTFVRPSCVPEDLVLLPLLLPRSLGVSLGRRFFQRIGLATLVAQPRPRLANSGGLLRERARTGSSAVDGASSERLFRESPIIHAADLAAAWRLRLIRVPTLNHLADESSLRARLLLDLVAETGDGIPGRGRRKDALAGGHRITGVLSFVTGQERVISAGTAGELATMVLTLAAPTLATTLTLTVGRDGQFRREKATTPGQSAP